MDIGERAGAVASVVLVTSGAALAARALAAGMASRIREGVCSVAMETGGRPMAGILGNVEDREVGNMVGIMVGMDRGAMPGRFRGGRGARAARGGRPADRNTPRHTVLIL